MMGVADALVRPVQWCTYAALFLPGRLLMRRHGIRHAAALREGRYIIASNHPTRVDAFITILALPPRTFLRLAPVRFVTAAQYMGNPFSKAVLGALGCISTEQKGEKVTAILVQRLEARDTIYLFPGGSLDIAHNRGRAQRPQRPKVGVAYLEKRVRGARVLPVHIAKAGVLWHVTFREPVRHQRFPADLQPLADDVMARVNGVRSASRTRRTRG